MSEEGRAGTGEVDVLLDRLQQGHQVLIDAIASLPPERFQAPNPEGDSIKRMLERSADEVNSYYGRLVAQALSLPQPPALEPADFGSLEEAQHALRAAHSNLSNLLHDLTAADLDRKTRLEDTAEYTLRQVLETTAAHYRLRAEQLKHAANGSKEKRR